ncbi:proton-coupled folate transporter-like [Pecten maximus]|uniref:proton-coupled folate transporter-like n=1 Tax=Pecten maximus TaxID=6579 RepID=UPI001458B2F3|nr:proton-coupled folate transporter-like [Pecten maximus]
MTSDTESKSLLDKQPEVQKSENTQYDSSGSSFDICIRVVVTILFVIGLEGGGLTKNQYVYSWIEKNTNSSSTVFNSSHGNITTASQDPCGGNISAGNEKKDQSLASMWLLYFSLCEHGIAVPMVLLYGSYSDYLGRKPLMIVSCVGYCMQYIMKSFIVYKNLPLTYFFIPYSWTGLCGGHYPFYLAMMASVADKTSNNKKRVFGIAIVETMIGVGKSSAQVGTGYFIKSFGYMYPMIAVAGLFAVCLLIIPFGIADTRATRSTKHVTLLVHIKKIFGMFFSKSHVMSGSVFTFNMALITFFLLYMAASDSSTLGTLYQLRSPFCWDSTKIGWYGFGTDILQYVFSLFVVKCLQICLSDGTVIVYTLISSIAGSVITGLATTSLMLYISSGAGILSVMARPLLRAFMSNMIDKDKQGAVLGNTYVVENICNLLSKTVFSEIYARTQTYMSGFVYLIMGAFYLSSLIIFIILLCCRKREETTINIQIKQS